MIPKTQRNLVLITAGIMAIVGIYELMLLQYSLPKLLGLLITTILSAIYVFALKKRRLKLAQMIYHTWWVCWFVIWSFLFIIILIAGIWAESLKDFLTILAILLRLGVFFGLLTFLWWVGLRGLERMAEP